MHDRGEFWSPAAQDENVVLESPTVQVRLLPSCGQVMVSGDLAAGLAQFGLSESHGLMAQAQGDRYALRLARGRVLVVGADLEAATAGWSAGVATTPMSGALAILEIQGPGAFELVARASSIDFRKSSPCAALSFAGVTSVLYRHGDGLRLHLDRGLVTYMLDWIKTSGAL